MLKIKVGEQKPVNYTIKVKSTNLPINLVNSTIIFQLKENPEQISDFLIEKTITETSNQYDSGKIYDAQNGKFSVFFKSEDTLFLDVNKDYYYTLWRVYENTKEVISASGTKVEQFMACPA
ncbi:MAG: hypothetical protein K6A44_07790 [bacterium]|nr:hypothetical protein [bacterium]